MSDVDEIVVEELDKNHSEDDYSFSNEDEKPVEELKTTILVADKPKRKYVRKNTSDKIIKSEGNVDIVFKQKTGKIPRQRVVIYKEDIETCLPEVVVELKHKKTGRPKGRQMTVVEELNKAEDIVISRVKPVKPMTDTQLKREAKRLELLEKVVKIESITGKTVKLDVSGEVKVRSAKQKEATEKLVLANAVRREIKRKEKLDAIQAEQSAQVLNIIATLGKAKPVTQPVATVATVKQWNL
jgi:hypothetical protein